MSVTDAVGWLGSALLVYSLLQARVLRFRLLNLVASLVLVGFNAAVQVWPMVGMNVVIAGINVWHIQHLLRTRRDERRYAVVPVGPDEPYLRRMLDLHARDIRRFNPGLGLDQPWPDGAGERLAFLVMDRSETVGLVLAHRVSEQTAQLVLDYVLPRYRDFTPGEFVYRNPGPFTRSGVTKVLAPAGMLAPDQYLARVGFRPDDGSLALDLAAR